MGSFYSSIHVQSTDHEGFIAAATRLATRAQSAFYIAAPKGGWIALYPPINLAPDRLARDLAKDMGTTHAIAFSLHDSDVLQYWYFKNGRLADSFNSMPDYFGKAKKADMNAVGNPAAFANLLNAPARKRWAQLIQGRMINGKEIGTLPDNEDDRLSELGSLLGIHGVLGAFEYLEKGEPLPDGRKAKNMTLVGELPVEEPADDPPTPRFTTMSMTESDGEMKLVTLDNPAGKAMTLKEIMALARKMQATRKTPKSDKPQPTAKRNNRPASTPQKAKAQPKSTKKQTRKQ